LTHGVTRVPFFGATIFLGAFLLFQVQLVIGKYILPWYGGVPMVWTTCMLCFQVLLLAGYAYAHLLVRRLPARRQRSLHIAVVAASVAVVAVLVVRWGVPLLADASWKPVGGTNPAWHIVRLLSVAVGVPFFVIATTAPLIQAWFGAAYPNRSPYRLYALSNLGSLLALLTYPTLVEVWLPLKAQAWLWTSGFLLFSAGIAVCARAPRAEGASEQAPPERRPEAARVPQAIRACRSDCGGTRAASGLRSGDWPLWLALSACGSALLLATTNYVSQEIAVVPFLWILPLALYLLSFVLCFDSERWYVRRVWATFLALGVMLTAFVLERGVWAPILLQIGVAALTLFAACMVCHGELARLKPAPARLTAFYLVTTIGGACGGAFVSVAAPLIFPGTWEYPLGLWMAAILALETFRRDPTSPLYVSTVWPVAVTAVATIGVVGYVFRESLRFVPEISDAWLFGTPTAAAVAGLVASVWLSRRGPVEPTGPRRAAVTITAVTLGVIVVGLALAHVAGASLRDAVEHSRSFYGIVHVEADETGDEGHALKLRHGRIVHGVQYQAAEHRREPTSYYARDTGIGLAIDHHPRRAEGLRVGVVGLGVGTLAAYAGPRDTFRFYELNEDVIRLAGPAGRTFTYLRESRGRMEIALGDARLSLEAELARGMPQRFDVLVIDAFSSDSVPLHLLTREAVDVYLKHLDPGGVLAIHISNRFLDLQPVLRGIARDFKLAHVFVSTEERGLTWRTTWALLSRDPARLAIAAIEDVRDGEFANAPALVWTDDYSNLLRVLKR
jgi:spermidine synthase